MNKKHLTIYTDGACSGNPGLGGWGFYLIYEKQGKIHTKTASGSVENTTNNQMEMQAIIQALGQLKTPCEVELFTDSKYVINGMTQWIHNWQKNNWRGSNKQAVKNKSLWLMLIELTQKHTVHWHWVKGHAGIEGNEKADELAQGAIKNYPLK